MDSSLETIYPLGHLTVAIVELIILLFAYPFFRLSKNWAMIVLPIVLVGLIYDNSILFSSKFIGEGELLENLSQIRYLLHYITVPLFIVVAIELASASEAKWANQFVRVSSWLLAFGLAGYDVIKNFVGLELKPETFAGVLRYVPVNGNILIITIIVTVFVLLVGIGIWVRTGNWFWLFIGALIGLLGNALPSAQVGTLPGSVSEFILALSLLLTQYHLEDDIDESIPAPEPPEGWECGEYSGYQVFWKDIRKEGQIIYTIYQVGSHKNGDFVRIYAPQEPYRKDGKLKLITYLHGFSLCLPQFYEKHLEELAEKGLYVFFPDYQKSDYPDFPKDNETLETQKTTRSTLKYWLFSSGALFMKLILRREVNKQELKKFVKQGIWKGLRVVLSTSLFIVVVNIISLFNREYAKNVVSMITTVIDSLISSPKEWLGFAINSTAIGWEKLCEHSKEVKKLDLSEQEIDFYVFGHSLGGLLALSWPYSLKENPDKKLEKFHPKQIITGDPAPNTIMGIPKIATVILGIFRFPFVTEPLKIKNTGTELKIPTGILHGNNDKIVKPSEWVKSPRSQEKGSFFDIASTEKNIYFSTSNKEKDLIANHNQSVTNTTYYGNGFMKNFGGAKDGPNAYNYQYIYPALLAVIMDDVQANELKDGNGFELADFQVLDEPT
ncbi:hypothetical protein [Dapis sp. BLCC M172]|uniref:hypothetical protein n=1 Tax=Dapis sp. BLCC M172 TaxID=2975281 RepID=UPI003CED078D